MLCAPLDNTGWIFGIYKPNVFINLQVTTNFKMFSIHKIESKNIRIWCLDLVDMGAMIFHRSVT